jgi:acetylornithine/LysW-gamma-L-lysine aminotransferase
MPDKDSIIQYKNLVSTYPFRGLKLVRGEGTYLYTEDNERYLDMMSNFGVNVLGYSHLRLNKILHEQIDRLTVLHSSFSNDMRSEALVKLRNRFNQSGFSNIKRFYFANSGAEAVEAALKFALLSTGRDKILAPINDYHGKTFAALSATTSGGGKYKKPFKKYLIDTDHFDFLDIDQLSEIISDEYAALIIEPIQGEGGIIIAKRDKLIEVSRLCKENGVILIVDEIQTGVGRTGKFLNIEYIDDETFRPDIVCLAKGIGGGVPVGVTCISEEINSKIPKGVQTSTFGGNPLAMAGIKATLDLIDKDFLSRVRDKGQFLINSLKDLVPGSRDIREVRGEGLMIGIEFHDTDKATDVLKKLQGQKVLAAPSSSNTIRLLPPLIIEKVDIEMFIKVFKKVI